MLPQHCRNHLYTSVFHPILEETLKKKIKHTFSHPFLPLCLVVSTQRVRYGPSGVAISWAWGWRDHSCSAGLCLVSLRLSKADHTVPSALTTLRCPPHHLSLCTSVHFPGSHPSPAITFYCWDYVTVGTFCMRGGEPGWMAVDKHCWIRVFYPLLWYQSGWHPAILNLKKDCFDINPCKQHKQSRRCDGNETDQRGTKLHLLSSKQTF